MYNLDSKLNIEHLPTTKEEIDRVFLKAAYDYAWEHSEDITTKTGAVIVRYKRIKMKGTNHFTDGVHDFAERHNKEYKYDLTIHAEEDLLTKSAGKGITTANSIMYCNFIPCINCYRQIKNSKVKKLIVHKDLISRIPDRWIESLNKTLYVAKQASFPIIMYEGKIGQGTKSLFDGKYWEP